MKPTEELVQEVIEKRKQLNGLKEQSAELAEAIDLAESYQALFQELLDRCKQATPTIVPMPYPVYPAPIMQPDWYVSPPSWYVRPHVISTTSDTMQIDLTGTTANPNMY